MENDEHNDLYRSDGKCRYVTICGRATEGKCSKGPEKCIIWEAMYDGECLAEEILEQ